MPYKNDILRKLARSDKWQRLYIRAKELNGIHLFSNNSDLSDSQMAFLQWIEIYSVLREDIVMKRPGINEEILEDDIRTDAYLLVRPSLLEKEDKDSKKKNRTVDSSGHAVYFRKG